MRNINNSIQSSAELTAFVNHEMRQDGRYHPNLGGVTRSGMANHFPMTIMSLAALGGSDTDIKRFKRHWPASRYRSLIEDLGLRDTDSVTLNNWPDYLGKAEFLIEFKRVFLEGITNLGAEQFIHHALNIMADSLPMGLFHPLIKLSFARMQGDDALIADALAYFAIRYQDLYGELGSMKTDEASGIDVSDSQDALLTSWGRAALKVESGEVKLSTSGASLPVSEALCGSSTVHQLALNQGFSITEANFSRQIAEICKAAAALYLYEPALTTLHAVTSAQALADLTLSLQNSDRKLAVKLWQRYWIWLTGLYLEKGAPKLTFSGVYSAADLLPDWNSLAKTAVKIDEVHEIKMVFSCKWLAQNLEDHEIYRIVASQVLAEYE